MFTRATLEPRIRKFCSNMIYVFIPENSLKREYFGRHLSAIAAKRNSQIRYLRGLSVEAGMAGDLTPIVEWIRDEIAKTYKPLFDPRTNREETATPELVLYHLSQGNEVNGINWSEGIYGIGSTPKTDFGNGITINSQTGEFYKNGQVVNKDNLHYDYKKGGKKGSVSYFDESTGNTYTAKFNSKGFSAYSASNSAGIVTKISGGSTLSLSDGDLWENIYNLLGQVTELVGKIATMLSGESADSLSPSQLRDGWMEPESAGTDWATILLVGAGALAVGSMLGKGSKGKKTKRDETN